MKMGSHFQLISRLRNHREEPDHPALLAQAAEALEALHRENEHFREFLHQTRPMMEGWVFDHEGELRELINHA